MTKGNVTKINPLVKHTSEPDIVVPLVKGSSKVPAILRALLERPTPHGSEQRLLAFMPVGYKEYSDNLVYDIGEKPTIIFSCHMDTVHPPFTKTTKIKLGTNTAGLVVGYTEGLVKGGITKVKKSVLGADDKLGMYIMLEMMAANIEGRYIFHVGEEVGCVGSGDIIDKHPELYKDVDKCIAFDRMGYTDIITHQRSRRCCSDEFAKALAADLNLLIPKEDVPSRLPFSSSSGIYTDSAEYMGDVAECTNISVGYFSQHTQNERFNAEWLTETLLPALLLVDWEALPVKRDPSVVESEYSYSYAGTRYNSGYGKAYNYSSVEYKVQNAAMVVHREVSFEDLLFCEIFPETNVKKCIERHILRVGIEDLADDIYDILLAARTSAEDLAQCKEDIFNYNGWYGGDGRDV